MKRLVLTLGLLAGCGELPGKEVGTYEVLAVMDENTCGPNVGAPQRSFDVQIRRDGGTGYWIGPSQVPVQGRIDEEGNFSFRTSEQILVRAGDEATGLVPCYMDQLDIAEGTAEIALSGSEELWVGVTSGADCRDQIGLMPGQFLELPCRMTFTLSGEDPGQTAE
jgi:hypothetical protein